MVFNTLKVDSEIKTALNQKKPIAQNTVKVYLFKIFHIEEVPKSILLDNGSCGTSVINVNTYNSEIWI